MKKLHRNMKRSQKKHKFQTKNPKISHKIHRVSKNHPKSNKFTYKSKTKSKEISNSMNLIKMCK